MYKYKITYIGYDRKLEEKHTIDFESRLDIDKLGDDDGELRDEIYTIINPKHKYTMIYDIKKL